MQAVPQLQQEQEQEQEQKLEELLTLEGLKQELYLSVGPWLMEQLK